MSELKKVRTILGLNQEEMAGLLGVTRSHLSLAETGKRKLPPPVRSLAALIMDILEQIGNEEIPEPPPGSTQIKLEILLLKTQVNNLTIKMEDRETDYRGKRLLELVCEKLKSGYPERVSAHSAKTMDVLLSDKRKWLEDNPKSTALLLRARLAGLEAMLRVLEGEV